ncbi:D-alanyl-D-alanine carboxypeptidase [Candidatus Giovannonibacteria bacterium]|nr:D-alanyl-D-alanine carboxypeptidase [Candidatus Giovannonibacteria bacterium]
MIKEILERIFLVLVLFAVLLFSGTFINGSPAKSYDVKPFSIASLSSSVAKTETEPPPIKKSENLFLDVDVDAKSAYVLDLKEGRILFEKNSIEKRPLASITKLLTALLAHELVPKGGYIRISGDAIKQTGDDGFVVGDKFKKEDLINFMLITSSNDAAYAFAEYMGDSLAGESGGGVSRFVAFMNERAKNLGLLNFSFLGPTGLDQEVNLETVSSADGTAFGAVLLIRYIYETYPEILKETRQTEISMKSQNGRIISGKSTNKAIFDIPQLVAAKTGFTRLAGGNLVFIFDFGESHPILVSLLGSSEEGRFEDAKKIVGAVYNFYDESP